MKSLRRSLVSALASAVLVGACVAPADWSDSGRHDPTSPAGGGGSPSSPWGPGVAGAALGARKDPAHTPLYGRDGGVVDSREPGSVTKDAPDHDVENSGTGRMYILELYQAAVDERDALQLEVAALNRALERTQAELDSTTSALAARGAELEQRTAERDTLKAETEDLAARLVTAQIRRLESEKLLIESKLEWIRSVPANAQRPAAPAHVDGARPAESLSGAAGDAATRTAPSGEAAGDDSAGSSADGGA
jgi:hypothetical protein